MIRILSIVAAAVLCAYLAFTAFFFRERKQQDLCRDIQVVVLDSLDKHFINEKDLIGLLNQKKINPINKPLNEINTFEIESELLKNEMISRIQVYKTPSSQIIIEVEQKMPILRIMGRNNYYIDNSGSTMPLSARYVAHVPIAFGHIEKDFGTTDLYEFALFLQKDDFWNGQITQIYVHPDHEVELIPRVGNHKIMLGSLSDFEDKLSDLRLFYEKAMPKVGWNKYSVINLKYKDQIICTKR